MVKRDIFSVSASAACLQVLCLGILVLGPARPAAALICTWTGSGATAVWSNTANWTNCGSRAPQNGDALAFPAAPGGGVFTSTNNIANLSLAGITISNVHYVISGNGVTVGGMIFNGAIDPADNTVDFSIPITLSGAATIANNSVDNATLQLGDIHLNGFGLSFTSGNSGGVRVNGTISGNGSIATTAPLVLLKANSYTGPTMATSPGTLTLSDPQALGAAGPGNGTTVSGTDLRAIFGASVSIDEDLAFSGINSTITAQHVTFTGAISFTDRELTITAGPVLLAGPVTGDELSIRGDTVLMNPANAWKATFITDATLTIGAAGALPVGPVVNNGTLDLNGFDATMTLIGTCGTIAAHAGTLTLDVPANNRDDFFGVIIGTGQLVKTGEGVQTLRAPINCTFTPPFVSFAGRTIVNAGELDLNNGSFPALADQAITINGGTLSIAAPAQIDPHTPITVNSAGTFNLPQNASAISIGSLAGSGRVTLNNTTLTIGTDNLSTTFSGVISSAASALDSLVKTGVGTLTLTGQNTYTGTTTVSQGALVVNGSLSPQSGVRVADTLGGTGTVGAVSVQTSGIISPGSSPGILHTGNVSFTNATSRFACELNGLTPGTGYDQIDAAGDVALNNATLLLTGTVAPQQGSTFTIINIATGHVVTGTFNGLAEGATILLAGEHYSISYRGGDGNDVVLTAIDPGPPITYFLSEGATGPFFDEDVLIANPNTADAPVTLTFSKEDGSQVTSTQTIAAQSHATVHVDKIPGLEATSASTQVRSDRGLPLVVERTMFWDKSYYAGHTGSAVDRPAADWFFAEGSQGFFNTFVLVINPNATPADVTFTFLREADTPVTKTINVGANTRLTLDCGSVPEIVNRSFGITVHASQPIMAERSMYFGTTPTRLWSGGTESAGVTSLSTHWFLAEGATGGFFDTFILLSNPNASDAHVTFQYLLDSGDAITVSKVVPAHARVTTNIETEADARLHNAAVSTVVTSDQPIIAERSMYWLGAAQPWGEGHNSFGVVDAGLHWGLAEGRTGGPLNFHTYILLANPQSTSANVTIRFLREGHVPVVKTFTVPPTSRFTIDSSTITELQNESFGADISVTNNVPIIVEESLYWDSNGFQFSGGTNATGSPLP